MPEIHIHFEHGLGDTANFARMIPLYTGRGYIVRVSTTPDKEWMLAAAGAEITAECGKTHPWGYPEIDTIWTAGHDWAGNKAGGNLSRSPLPDIGTPDELWPEYIRPFPVSMTGQIPPDIFKRVDAAISGLSRPLILLHTIGNTGQTQKSLPCAQHVPFYKSLLDSGGTVLLLDWDGRVPTFPHYRLRHLIETIPAPQLTDLAALICQSDILIGVDSGPFHFAGLFPEKTRVGIFREGYYPSTYCVPGPNTYCVAGAARRAWNIEKRWPFQILETDWATDNLAQQCLAPLQKDFVPPVIRQWLGWCRGINPAGMGDYCDRHIGFREIFRRAMPGNWIETGTIRSSEDWGGAGFSTYLFGAWLAYNGRGVLHSVDTDLGNCKFARRRCDVFGNLVAIINSRGTDYLAGVSEAIDFLYCDSCDTTNPEHSRVCLDEVKMALPKMAAGGVIAFDDTPFSHGTFIGKGALAVPFLLDSGWRIRYAGYQVIMEKNSGT